MGLKPIDTEYKGYRFRSRLEARWAVFFDAMEVQLITSQKVSKSATLMYIFRIFISRIYEHMLRLSRQMLLNSL